MSPGVPRIGRSLLILVTGKNKSIVGAALASFTYIRVFVRLCSSVARIVALAQVDWYWHRHSRWRCCRTTDVKALCHIDAQLTQQCERRTTLHIFRDNLHAGFLTDFSDKANHLLVHWFVHQVLNEAAIDLDVIDR